MDEKSIQIQMLAEKHNEIVLEDKQPPPNSHTEDAPKQENESSECTDIENIMTNEIHEVSPDQGGHTLPILKKIIYLSTKIQDLKQQHIVLAEEAKLSTKSFLDSDALRSFKSLGIEYELLRRKFLKEYNERKRLSNELIEMKGNIRVFCRCRPLNAGEILNGSAASVLNFEASSDYELQVVASDSTKKQFKFDHVFKPEDNQEAVFAQTKPVIASVLDGFNVCIFAYGQTGTGKTFTMEGTPEQRGVNYRTLEELFRIAEERHGVMKYELCVSMLEVYNEKIRDLLVENSSQTKKLEVKQSAEGTQEVPGLVEAPVYGTEDVWELLKTGNRVRSVGSTSANELSSRSHCLLRVTVVGENLVNGDRTRSRLWLVDLAGSERVGKTEVEGERLKESQFINKSLSALGDVISALASKSAHIPYRNSKLTHILQSSLGGDCKTLMFVQVSPSETDLGETLCSLNFASRVRGVESGPARKQVDHAELLKYKQMVEKLKHDEKETRKLQDNNANLLLRLASREHQCKTLQEKVRGLENQIAEERKTRLKQESRSIAAVSAQNSSSTLTAARRNTADKKPPLNPSQTRMPLKRISNFMPSRSPIASKRYNTSMNSGKENTEAYSKPKSRASIAVRPPALPTGKLLQPRRRVSSIPAICPERTSDITTPLRSHAPPMAQLLQPRRRVSSVISCPETTSDITTPLRASQFAGGSSVLISRQRRARYSNLFAPLPESRASVEMTTPMSIRSSSKFRGSPIQGVDSRVARHPAAVALQRKPVVWSPLKLRGLKNNNNRRSWLMPSRSYNELQ
ncbi:hypothetical protein HN51_054832 [Arachis hypogaea]|uniref:Kinesin-like protein n=1 Tax=Arachis hypogaea TaxID=3818 RepID=A0A6B9VB27_ARAHY|nr:kinesin-like protein KIN-14S [Arachis hypogaea]QHN77452.1 Kinesin-like protein [Arachis hypogaea]